MLYCHAEFEPKEGREQELFEALQGLEKETRVEKGCVLYRVMRPIANPYGGGTHLGIVFNEIWESSIDFANHNENDHVQAFFKKECLDEDGSAKSWNVNVFE